METESIQQRFTAALDALINQVKADRSILAALLCGSLSHDSVWAKSDIDLVFVTMDDKKVDRSDVALDAGGVNVHAILLPRAEFRKIVEGSVRNSFLHSFLAKGRLLYTHDPTIAELCSRLGDLGERDTQVQLLRAATSCAAGDLQGQKVFRHARRPRLHGAVDPRRHPSSCQDRGDRRAAAGRPGGHP